MDNDDKPVGRVLTRREMLALLGGSGAALFVGIGLPRLVMAQDSITATPSSTPLPTCVVRPELTEGPYFVDDQLNRSDIRVDPSNGSIKEGLPLHLVFHVSDVTGGTCAALADAQVDVWHCDANGVYSGVQDAGFDTSGQMWLRGYQITDEDGVAEFLTIVPGWYSGRAVHIHFKIRTTGVDGQSYEFTSQFFFDPAVIEEIYAQQPYVAKGLPDTSNERDNIYQQSNGQLTLELVPLTADERETLAVEDGYSATFDIGLDLSDASVGASDSGGRPRSGGRPGRP
ncbi:MAG: intradiol ring-cleavage dioxygenase [Anaerolineaceae bacterium]|nr:intradiol ring-cleavage dioxygenase [Anaerolineaceae bacterium]